MEKKKCLEKLTNEVLKSIEVQRMLLNNILRRNSNWFGHILRRNCLLYDATEGQMPDVKYVGIRRRQLLGDLKNSR